MGRLLLVLIIWYSRTVIDSPENQPLPNGHVAVREASGSSVVVSGSGRGVVAVVSSDHHVLMVKQFRPALGFSTWEFPRGVSEDGNGSENCSREVAEETGVDIPPPEFSFLGCIAPDTGLLTTVVEVHRAWVYSMGDLKPQEEGIEARWVPKDDVLAHLYGEYGTIDSMSLAALRLSSM